MKKRRLGISLYPERSTFEQDVAYLEKAAKLGFDLLFIALLGAGDRQQTIDRYKPLLAKAKELGFEIEADVNPMMFERMGINASFFHGPLDLSFFTELQVDILRLDLGLNDMEEAFLSKNKEGIKICVNGCNTQDHVGHVLAAGGDRDMILGCHNYYPHRYTGVSLEHFEKGSAPMVKHNLRLQSFVTSQNPEAFGPWPVTEGLPTLEMHRDWPIEIQVGHYVMMGYVNDIIIANAYATDAELEAMAAANSTKIMFHMTPAEGLPESMTVLRQPVRNIYLVSTSVMDLFLALDGLDSVTLSGTQAEGWYLDEARAAMEAGRIAYAGKYSAPDYEKILAANCGLAIENTMIYHTPEVKEQLERFGIPVLVERSSYESGPLARMEWIKFYGILLGKEELAQQVFDRQAERIAPLLDQQSTGKSCAFFSISANNLANVRKGGDYVARMIEMAGADYVFADLTDSGNSLSTMNLPLEDFYAGARDADFLIYNSTIEGVVSTTDELVAKCSLLADFKAVQNGHVWCVAQSFFQQSMELADFILELHRLFTEDAPDGLQYFIHVE